MVLSVDRAGREAGDGLDSLLTGEKRKAGVSCHDRLGGAWPHLVLSVLRVGRWPDSYVFYGPSTVF